MPEKDPHALFYRDLGKSIKERRIDAGLSQEDLAKKVGLSRVSIVNIEKGIQKIQVHALVLVASILQLNLDNLKQAISSNNSDELGRNYEKRIEELDIKFREGLKKNLLDIKKHL